MILEVLFIGAASAVIWSRDPPSPARARSRRRIRQSAEPTPRIAPWRPTLPSAMIAINRDIALTGASLGMIVGGLVFNAPLLIAGVLLNLITAGPWLLRDLHTAVFRERRIGMPILEITFVTLLLVTRQFVALALCFLALLMGRKLVLIRESRARAELDEIIALQTSQGWIKLDGQELSVPSDSLQPGDVVVVKAGDFIPADGRIVEGAALIDQCTLTGDADPVTRTVGDSTFAATLVLSGRVEIRVEKAADDTAAAHIRRQLLGAAITTADLGSRVDAIANLSAPPTLAVSGLALLMGMSTAQITALINADFARNLSALGPVSALRHLTAASSRGVLIRDIRALESLASVDTIVFDEACFLALDHSAQNCAHAVGADNAVNWPGMTVDVPFAGRYDQPLTLHPQARQVIDRLRHSNVKRIEIVSGDASAPTGNFADDLGIDGWHTVVSPTDKAALIERLQRGNHRVCFIGDGSNDNCAFARADVSVSLCQIDRIATDTAQIVLIDKSLEKLPEIFDIAQSLSRRLNRGVLALVIPGLFSMAGVLVFKIGVISTILINQTGLILGMATTDSHPAGADTKKTSDQLKRR